MRGQRWLVANSSQFSPTLLGYLYLMGRDAYCGGEPVFDSGKVMQSVDQARSIDGPHVTPVMSLATVLQPPGLCLFFPGVRPPVPSARQRRNKDEYRVASDCIRCCVC
jgi:hypothetical protein